MHSMTEGRPEIDKIQIFCQFFFPNMLADQLVNMQPGLPRAGSGPTEKKIWRPLSPSKGCFSIQSQVSSSFLDGEGQGQETRRDWPAAERRWGVIALATGSQRKKESQSAASHLWRKPTYTSSKFLQAA